MYLIPLLIVVVSVCGILFIFFRKARALAKNGGAHLVYPEMKHDEQRTEALKEVSKAPFLSVLKIGGGRVLAGFTEKFFRKVRIRLMRLENWVTNITNKLRARRLKKDGDVSQHADFLEEKEGGENGNNLKGDKGEQGGIGSFVALNSRDEKFDEEYWINILKQEPTSAYPYKKLGEIYTAWEDYKEARIVLAHALRLDPSDEEAKRMFEELKGKRTRRKVQSA